MHLHFLVSMVQESIRQDIVALMRRRARISELPFATHKRLRGASVCLESEAFDLAASTQGRCQVFLDGQCLGVSSFQADMAD